MVSEPQKNSKVNTLLLLTLIVVSSSIASFIGIQDVLLYHRVAIFEGEIWRLFTGHFVHFSLEHFIANILLITLITVLVQFRAYQHYGLFIVFAMVFISLGLLMFHPNLAWYGGLSGVAYGGLYYCALHGLKENTPWNILAALLALFIPAEIGLEWFFNTTSLSFLNIANTEVAVIHLSHLLGVVGAVLFFVIERSNKSQQQ